MGNIARIRERRGENAQALLQLFQLQDRIAAEVIQAHAQAQEAQARWQQAEEGLTFAADSLEKNFEGLSQTRRAGDVVLLVIRPQEALAAVQALAQAYNDYYAAAADHAIAQFRLYRALGRPAQGLACEMTKQ
jgi:hypothetical protein